MNLIKNSKRLIQKVEVTRWVHQKHLPPVVRQKKPKDFEENKVDTSLPAKIEKASRDIFGATILPHNLSFEDAKRLSDNQVKLEDIPIVDENAAAEELEAEKIKANKMNFGKQGEPQKMEEMEMAMVNTSLLKEVETLRKPVTDMFWSADSYEDIPGPTFGQTFFKFVKDCTRQLTTMALMQFIKNKTQLPFREYGPIVKLPPICGGKIVLVSRPEHIFGIYEQDLRHPINSSLDSIQKSWANLRDSSSRVIYHLTDEWEEVQRSIKQPQMKAFEKYFDDVDDITNKFIQRIKTIRNRQDEVPEDFLQEINKWSLECLCTVIFDKTFGFLDNGNSSRSTKTSQLMYSLNLASKNLSNLETGFQFWRFINTPSLSSLGFACSTLEHILSEYVGQIQLGLIKRRDNVEENTGRVGLIEALLLQDDMSPDEIIGNVIDTLLIGVNTMAMALGFFFYHMSQNPRVESELHKEIKKLLPDRYSRLEYELVPSFKYLQACLKESLRLKMPMPVISRILSRNVLLSNYQIPKGTMVLMTAQVEGLKKENFDEPSEFVPERWLDTDKSHPFASLPLKNYFEDSFERRIAEVALLVCAAQAVRNFHIEYQYGEIEATHSAISLPNRPLKFTFVDRVT